MLYMAPEVALSEEYSKSIDVWSLGIIMYNLLSGGAHPLHEKGESSEKYKEKLKKKTELKFEGCFSDLAKDLILKCTAYNPAYRYNVDQILKHPWITRSQDTKVPLTYFEMIEHIDCQDKLKQVMKTVISFLGYKNYVFLISS
jgi:serine/threonine protein kinase